jgi:hypothetical protein
MAWYKNLFVLVFCALVLAGFAMNLMAASSYGRGCQRSNRVTIEDLSMSPDPIMEGQRVRSWRVQVRFEGNRTCDTEIEIRDLRNNVVASESAVRLRPGVNEIALRPDARFQFTAKEQCLKVFVNVEGSKKEVDARRKICASQRGSWSLRGSSN